MKRLNSDLVEIHREYYTHRGVEYQKPDLCSSHPPCCCLCIERSKSASRYEEDCSIIF